MPTIPCPHCGHLLDPDATTEEKPLVGLNPLPPTITVARPSVGGKPTLALALVAPYAVLMTVVAATYAYKFHSARFEHPLALIPDLVGEYRNAAERKGGAHSVPLPRPDQPLPAQLTTSLGSPISIGQVEVTPLKIEERTWTAFSQRKDEAEAESAPINQTLVLTVRIKNVSNDVPIFPMDPFFDRRPKDGDRAMPFTLIECAGKQYFGGVLAYETQHDRNERAWLAGRETDGTPLQPGESREAVLVTRPSYAMEIADSLRKTGGEAVWRIHVRRGLYEFNGREFSVAAVVGVRFTANEIN